MFKNGDRPLFDPDCRRCPRLAGFLEEVRSQHPGYHAAPVPAFGDPKARCLIVGLAPGMHGANATGRPFTGDYAGVLLYETLHALGFANQAEATHRDDGLSLKGIRITNAVKCLPPQNKPLPAEIRECNAYLKAELDELPQPAVILALGSIAHQAVIRALGLKQADYRFAHGAEHRVSESRTLIDSYHCSRYNTQTRRLTAEMFHAVLTRVRERVDAYDRSHP
ncbi:uracil-DNA glycosylase [Ectothiorhodosinus mongolicus]|uniref:uracil-DNA glycosylase n=1 Tax=Ectothiorhodosinus mongolicus TaxID=233100 RepID=UPI000977E22C|nr:uracil-DNA glycosylase [Ectothiorhodosinus mongolicus]ULX58053.1 SPO1 DNA polymerase [Ectothiorhodosinus mongolicus]